MNIGIYLPKNLIPSEVFLLVSLLLIFGCWQPPVAQDAVFNDLKTGELWNDHAAYVDSWYAIEKIDEQTIIIGEPKSSQYNLSYLIIGENEAILFDTGAGERGDDVQSIGAVVKKFSNKPVRVVISHFHYDHTGGVDEFDGVTMIDLPHIRAKIEDGAYQVSALENAGTQRPLLTVNAWVKHNEVIDLGNRKIQFVNTPGHTPESVSLIDHHRKYAFTGDLIYQHLGGIIVFVPGSDHDKYIESIDSLVVMTGDGYRYFGAHGLPEYGKSWLMDVGGEFKKIKHDEIELELSASSLAPLVPLRQHAKGQILIYFTPFLNPSAIFSWWFATSILMPVFLLSLALLFRKKISFLGRR